MPELALLLAAKNTTQCPGLVKILLQVELSAATKFPADTVGAFWTMILNKRSVFAEREHG